MKIIILKTNLIEGLNSVEKTISNNQNFPILKNFKLQANKKEGEIKLTSTDLEIAITKKVSGKIISGGETLIPFSVFNKIVKNLNSEKINIEKKENKLMISSDNYEGVINCENVEDYPIIPEIQNKKNYLKISSEDLINSLNKTIKATNYSDIRPEINGVYVNYEGNDLVMAGTDSFRLVEKKINENQIESNFDNINFIIPLKTVENLIRVIEEDGEIEISADPSQMLFKGGDVSIISRLIDGNFPDYKSVIPNEINTEIFINKDEIESAIKTTSAFSGKANDVLLKSSSDGKVLEVSSSESSIGSNQYRIPSKTKGDTGEFEIIFNWKYLKDGLGIFDGEEIILGINDPSKAVSMRSKNNKDLIYIVMPIKG